MKKVLFLLIICFSFFPLFSQEKKNTNKEKEIEIINEVVKTKYRKYSQLRKALKGKFRLKTLNISGKKAKTQAMI